MENKIKQYVEYQFRFKHDDESIELKEEIIANLNDRYHENMEKYQDEEKAYIETIKQMGDFVDEEQKEKEYKIKPSFVDTTFIIATVVAIFGFVICLVNILVGVIFTAISIAGYSGGAYYLYSQAQYEKNERKDIEKHNILLSKIIKYLKTNFIFWAINIAIILSDVISDLIVGLAVLIGGADATDIGLYFALLILLMIILIPSLLFVQYILYSKILIKYEQITGEKNPKSFIKDSIKFFEKDGQTKTLIKNKFLRIFNVKYVSIIGLIISLLSFFENDTFIFRYGNYHGEFTVYSPLSLMIEGISEGGSFLIFGLLTLIGLVALFISSIIGIIKKQKSNLPQLIIYYSFVFFYIAYIFVCTVSGLVYIKTNLYLYINLIVTIILIIISVIKNIIKKNLKKQEKLIDK